MMGKKLRGEIMGKPKALRKLIKSAKMGNPAKMYELGIRYQLGRVIPQDLMLAAEWIAISAEFGYQPAIDWLKDYAFDDDPTVQGNS